MTGLRIEVRPGVSLTLTQVSEQLAALRIQRDKLIREHPGTLREIATAAGLSHQQVANIKAREAL